MVRRRLYCAFFARARAGWWLGLSSAVLSAHCTPLESGSDVLVVLDVTTNTDAAVTDAGTTDADLPLEASIAVDAGCIDPDGFDGVGCYRCEPTSLETLERACSDVSCVPFDNLLRLTRLGGDEQALPELPIPSVSDVDAGTGAPTAGGVDASEGDAAIDLDATASNLDAGAPDAPALDGNPTCESLTAGSKVVYVTGSSAAKPFLAQVGQQFAASDVRLVYTSTGSCVGVDAVVNATEMRTGAAPAPAKTALTWTSLTSNGEPCMLPESGVVAHIGVSDVFAQSCPGFELVDLSTAHIRDAHGPVQTMAFVVPAGSRMREISSRAAYFVYGFGTYGGVLDETAEALAWNDESKILQRTSSSGTQAMIAAAIGVPPDRFRGKSHRTSDELLESLLQASVQSEETASLSIGILGADYVDGKGLRAQVRMLAFQDANQACAVYPDSTETARDRQNVRDGHYPIWGPLHLLHRVDDQGRPLDPDTRQEVSDVLSYLSGTKPLPSGVKLLDLFAQIGLVPECAMRVSRSMDGGDIVPYRPSNPCACLFEERATGQTDCATCKVQADCESSETCSNGYCEPG